MAEIYLGVKDVSAVPGSSAHMYFIFEFSDGTKYYVRGGAEGGGFSGSLIGNLAPPPGGVCNPVRNVHKQYHSPAEGRLILWGAINQTRHLDEILGSRM
jgi:hypothetical protein